MRFWHTVERGVVFIHVAGMAVSVATWLTARFMELDRSWMIGSVIGFLYCLILLTGTWLHLAWKRKYRARLRDWWQLRRYTSAGLSWSIVNQEIVRERAEATLRITPTGLGGELPQPLKLIVTCTGYIETVVRVCHYPSETDDVEIGPAEGSTRAFITLQSPRLYPPGYLDVRLRSTGAGIRVSDVKWSK